MKEIYCDKCGKELKPGSQAIAITAGSISKYDEGFSPDEDPYIKTLCGDCCDVSKAIEDAPRTDKKEKENISPALQFAYNVAGASYSMENEELRESRAKMIKAARKVIKYHKAAK